jgi:hypothetical protein
MSSVTCTHSDELLTLGALGLLSAAEQARLEAQVSACDACRQRWQDYQALAGAMPQLVQIETAPSKALKAQPTISPNGKAPRVPAFFEAGASPESSNLSLPQRPSVSSLQRRYAHRRLVKVVSGLAAAVLLLGVVGGFWLLFLSHSVKPNHPPTTAQPTKTILYNPCTNDIAKGVEGAPPACGVVVMDYSQTLPLLEEIDPTTGKSLALRPPLQVGNAFASALSLDHRTLTLGIYPNDSNAPTSIQVVWLDTWQLGATVSLPLSSTEGLQDLAVTPNGSGVYAVIDDYAQTPWQGSLRYFALDRASNTLTLQWSKPLPFIPGNGNSNDGSFALSADGTTAYVFSAATTPAQLAAFPLDANGLGSPQTLKLPSIASGAIPPVNDDTYIYKSGDPIYQWYQPAVIFAPEQSRLYLVHAEAQDPSKDVLVIIDLVQMKLGNDIPIHATGQSQAALPLPLQDKSATSTSSVILQPQMVVRPQKGVKPYIGRNETGAVSPDGHWIYLSGSNLSPQFNTDGSWSRSEQETYLGLLKIDTSTGQIVGQWFQGMSFSRLSFGQDGRNLYLFGSPAASSQGVISNTDVLLVFDTQQEKVVNAFPTIQSGWFILPLP